MKEDDHRSRDRRDLLSDPDFAETYERFYRPEIKKMTKFFCQRLNGDIWIAEDLAHDTFHDFFEALLQGTIHLDRWQQFLWAIGRNKLNSFLRAKYRKHDHIKPEGRSRNDPDQSDSEDFDYSDPCMENLVHIVDNILIAQDAKMHLSSLDQQVIHLKYIDDFSWQEIACELGLSVDKLRNRGHRALKELRRRWK